MRRFVTSGGNEWLRSSVPPACTAGPTRSDHAHTRRPQPPGPAMQRAQPLSSPLLSKLGSTGPSTYPVSPSSMVTVVPTTHCAAAGAASSAAAMHAQIAACMPAAAGRRRAGRGGAGRLGCAAFIDAAVRRPPAAAGGRRGCRQAGGGGARAERHAGRRAVSRSGSRCRRAAEQRRWRGAAHSSGHLDGCGPVVRKQDTCIAWSLLLGQQKIIKKSSTNRSN